MRRGDARKRRPNLNSGEIRNPASPVYQTQSKGREAKNETNDLVLAERKTVTVNSHRDGGSMDFDEVIDRRGTHSAKWDLLEQLYGVPSADGIAMWVADMDFRPPKAARLAIERMLDHGIFGYYGDEAEYREAICRWMKERHGWHVNPDWIFSVHGLVNGTALCVDTFSAPGDSVVLFTPVYHAFSRIILAGNRHVNECRLVVKEGRYEFDFEAYDRQMTGNERIAILCSPQNPGGQTWNEQELRQVAAFCERHDLVLVSDEIHHDLILPGHRHVPFPNAVPDSMDRLIMLTAPTKTFNLAGGHTGNVIIPDHGLRSAFAGRMKALGISPNSFGIFLAEAVYSEEGAEWVDRLMQYLDRNRILFDESMNSIPGVNSMPLEATYLAWVDFRGTGLSDDEVARRIERVARIAVNKGPTFGSGGEGFQRFNFAMPRSILEQALDRLQDAFRSTDA